MMKQSTWCEPGTIKNNFNFYEAMPIDQNKKNGFVALYRSIWDHWLWQHGNEERLKWWIDLMLLCNHSEKKVNIKNELFDCRRGQTLRSLEDLSRRWRVDKSAVRRFLDLLKKDGMITTEDMRKTTRITLCNYGDYQDWQHADDTQTTRRRNNDDTQTTPNNNGNNEEHVNNDAINSFDRFWNDYEKKVGKQNTLKEWKKLNDSERQKAIDQIPSYKAYQPDVRFRKDPERYLKQKLFNDEFKITKAANQKLNGNATLSVFNPD